MKKKLNLFLIIAISLMMFACTSALDLVKTNQVEELNRKLSEGDISEEWLNEKDEKGNNALIQAVYDGKVNIVKILLTSGANVNIKNNFNKTALEIAVEQRDEKITAMLIDAGAKRGGGATKNGLVAYYPFNGNANDESGNGNNAIKISKSVKFDSGVNGGQSVHFGGYHNPGYIRIKSSKTLSFQKELTVVYWVKIDDLGAMNGNGYLTKDYSGGCVIAKDHDRDGFFSKAHLKKNGEFSAYLTNNAYYSPKFSVSGGTITGEFGKWIQVAFVIKNTLGSLYYNGRLSNEREINTNFSIANSNDLYIGRFSETWYPFNGCIDEVRIYNRALTDSEIRTIYYGRKDLLLTAVKNNDSEIVKLLLKNKTKKDDITNEALILALKNKFMKITKILIDAGVNIDIKNKNGDTALIIAAKNRDVKAVKAFINAGADINIKDKNGNTPLMIILKNKDIETAKIFMNVYKKISQTELKSLLSLFSNNTNLNPASIEKIKQEFIKNAKNCEDIYTCLEKDTFSDLTKKIAIDKAYNLITDFNDLKKYYKTFGNTKYDNSLFDKFYNKIGLSQIDELISYYPQALNILDAKQRSALTHAVLESNIEIVKDLIKSKVNLNFKYPNNFTILLVALMEKEYEISKLLIESGADVNAKDDFGVTAIMSCDINKPSIIELLIKNGADLNTKDLDGNPIFIKLLIEKHSNVAKKMILRGADVNAKNKDGATALMYSIYSNNLKLTKFLIKHGADVNLINKKNNFIPLMQAIDIENVEILKVLLKSGANIEIKGSNNVTPLFYAVIKESDSKIIKTLIKHGANINFKGYEHGWTPLMNASAKGNVRIVNILIEKGCKLNIENNYDKTALYLALHFGKIKVANILRKAGAVESSSSSNNNSSSSTSSKLSNTVPIYYTSRNGNDITYHIKYKDHYTSFIYFKNGDYYDMGLLSGSEKTFSKALKRALKEVIYFDDISKVRELDKYKYMDN